MKKLLLAVAGLPVVAALGGLLSVGQAQQTGGTEQFPVPVATPVTGPAQPVLPGMPGLQKTPGLPPPSTLEVFGGAPAAKGNALPGGGVNPTAPRGFDGQALIAEKEKNHALREFLSQNFDAPDPNLDIDISHATGKGIICVHWYTGKDAAQWAREMVFELRNNPKYKLNAFTYRKGVEECIAEQDRVRKEAERQLKWLNEKELPTDTPLRVAWVHYDIQYAVVVGGYKDMKAASEDLKRIRELPHPDPTRVKMHTQYRLPCDPKSGAPKEGDYSPINPFPSAMVSANPSARVAASTGINAEDIALMKSLNSEEPYSLLKCGKKYTLGVKVFSMAASLKTQGQSTSWVDKISFWSSSNQADNTAISAHNLAALLRQGKWEAYVLHTKHLSYVTVGSYDSPDDPRIARDQQALLQFNDKMQLPPWARLMPTQLMAVPR